MKKRTKISRDETLRRHIRRITRFHEASVLGSLRIQKLAWKRKEERKRKTTVERLFEAKLMPRDYRQTLPIMVMSTIIAQHGKTPAHYISLQRPGSITKLTKIIGNDPGASETKDTRMAERGEGTNLRYPWLVPPWENDSRLRSPLGHKRFGGKKTHGNNWLNVMVP